MVYFVQAGKGGAVKIGYARDPFKRLRYLQASNCERLTILRTLPGSMKTERELHRRFREFHIHLEWFRFCLEMMTIQPEQEAPASAAAPVFSVWPDAETFAKEVGQKADTVRRWRLRNQIPLKHWARVAGAAARRGRADITPESLMALALEARAA